MKLRKILLASLIISLSQTSIHAMSKTNTLGIKAYSTKSGFIMGYLSGLVPVIGQLQLVSSIRATSDAPKEEVKNYKRGAFLGHAAGIVTFAAAANCAVKFIINRLEEFAVKSFL